MQLVLIKTEEAEPEKPETEKETGVSEEEPAQGQGR